MSTQSGQESTQETVPATRTDVQWVTFVASGTAFAVWLVKRIFFGPGELPVEVSSMIQLGVPLVMSALAAEWRFHVARARGATSPPATPGQ